MNKDVPFTAHGDEAIEARIVAWVLGEASAFEAAELDRLCEERPELMVFKRRIAALNGMLAEAENAKPDQAWRLPPEKGNAVEDVLGKQTVVGIEGAREKRVKRSGRRALLAIAACLVLLVVVAGFASPMFFKQHKKSDIIAHHSDRQQRELALMESEPRGRILETELPAELIEGTPQPMNVPNLEVPKDGPAGSETWSLAARVAGTSEENVKSVDAPASYGTIATDGRAFNYPNEFEPPTSNTIAPAALAAPAAPAQMGSADVDKPMRSDSAKADGMRLDALSPMAETSGEDASDRPRLSAAGGTNGYLSLPKQVDELEKAIHNQQDRLEEQRNLLGSIVRTKGITYKGQDSFYAQDEEGEERETAIQRALDAQDYVDAKREFEQDQALLQQMKLKLMRAKAETPMPDPGKLMEEIPASEEPYSTFSLNIGDASFRIAQAALAKGEQPDPAGIKVEQFYNAVDYGDPAPASNEPVACAIEQAVHPVIPGRNLVRIALKTAAAGRSAAQPLRLTLLVDQSGSMTRADRRAAMDKALGGLVGLLTKDDIVNVIGFSRTPRLLADGMSGDQAAKLADLVNQAASEGGTNLEEAIKLADQLALRHQQPGAQNRIVLFTDGAANLGDADPERLAEKVKEMRQKGIAFDIAGIAADDLNDALLGELARNGNGRYYVVGKDDDDIFAKQLAGAFQPAAENVKVQVRFNPERVASYKLIGFEKDRLKTEDFRNDKVDAAELAAEEAGVAIYQVEPLPEGRGEIGEVSVRFRDTAAGEMVERSWTIPHDSAAPALDRATPSMQLATLAMLAAEKLKGGPLGEAVDFSQFAAAQAEVKAHYSGSTRVAELLRMIEMLK
ncbi:MAG: YfbK domain-containing protein [Luteolibacter sp.]